MLTVVELEKLKVGDTVVKITGDYRISGQIRSLFTMANNAVRLVVEHTAEGGGSFLHIYSPNNLVTQEAWHELQLAELG